MTATTIRDSYASQLLDRAADPVRWFSTRFVQFAQYMFRNGINGEFQWYPDETATTILITDQIPIPAEVTDRMPSIQLVLASEQNQALGIGYALGTNPKTGATQHIDLISGTASYNVIAREPEVAHRIANHMRLAVIRHQRELIRLALLQHIGMQVQMGPPSPPGALVQAGPKTGGILRSVFFQYFYSEKWERQPGLIPWGQAAADSSGIAPNQGVALEQPEKVRSIKIDARLLRPGALEARSEDFKKLVNAKRDQPKEGIEYVGAVRHAQEKIEEAKQDYSPLVNIDGKVP